MSSYTYQDELIFSFDDSLDLPMDEEFINEQVIFTPYNELDHLNLISEPIYQDHNVENSRLCYVSNSAHNYNFSYMDFYSASAPNPRRMTDVMDGASTNQETIALSMDYKYRLSPYSIDMNPPENSPIPSQSTDSIYFSRRKTLPNIFSDSIYIPHTFDGSPNDQNLYSPLCSVSSTSDVQYPSCDYDVLATLPNSPPQNDHDVSASSEGYMRRTNNAKPLACEICNRFFGRPQEVTRHQVCHTGERKYRCLTCDKKFARRDALLRHNRSHSKLKVKSNSSVRVAK